MGMQKDMKKKGTKTKYTKDDLKGEDSNEDCSTKVIDKKLQDYVIKKIIKKYLKKKSSLKTMNMVGYSNDDNPFGDCNLSQPFIWRKQIEDYVRREGLTKSLKQPEEDRPRDNIEKQINQIKERKEQKAIKDMQCEMNKEFFEHDRARLQYQDWQKKEQEFELEQNKLRSNLRLQNAQAKGTDIKDDNIVLGSRSQVLIDSCACRQLEECELQEPKYFSEVHMGYTWNKYNQMHYIHDKPPPKNVQGYKFKIFYPNLVDKTKIPTYFVYMEQDRGNDGETCFLSFHAGPPYKDIVFWIVNNEWEYSYKKGFKCTFEHEVFYLDFSFKRYRYRR